MEDIMERFTSNMAFEVGLNYETASAVTAWLNTEAILDYDLLKEIFGEPRPTLKAVEQAVGA